MTFKHKLSRRLALLRSGLVVGVLVLTACNLQELLGLLTVSVSVNPAAATVAVDSTVQLTATPLDGNGAPLSGRTALWGTSNASVAFVSSSGLVRGVATGTADITATIDGKYGTSAITVSLAPPPPPPPGSPGTVTDLAVVSVTDNAATLSFTEVTNGTGLPASYDIRFAVGTISWGSASSVTQGTCSVPVAGTAIGAMRSCTVLGLAAATPYQFQLIAFRGTLNVDAVFGSLSNVVTATTTGSVVPPPPPPPGTVFAEDFESGTLAAWPDGVNSTLHRVITDPTLAHSGSRLLEVTYPAGSDGGWLTHWFMPGYDSIYVSLWVRFPTGWQGGTKLVALYGSRTDNQWSALGKGGQCPSGTDFFGTWLVTESSGNPGPTRFYSYYPAMAREPDGITCWGRFGDGTETYVPPLTMSTGSWHHLEFWVKLNTPSGSDALQMFWIDGVQRGLWGGLSFRTSTILKLNSVQLSFSNSATTVQTQKLYIDDVRVLTARP